MSDEDPLPDETLFFFYSARRKTAITAKQEKRKASKINRGRIFAGEVFGLFYFTKRNDEDQGRSNINKKKSNNDETVEGEKK